MEINVNYDYDFICDLKKQVDSKIAFVSNRDYKDSVYGLSLGIELDKYASLLEYSEILDKILKCHSCYKSLKIENIISQIKNTLNNC